MSKTKKIICILIAILFLTSSFCLTVFANTYSYNHSNILNSNTVLTVSNGKDYAKFYSPTLVNNYDSFSECSWYIKGYNPPTGSAYDTQSTNVYLRLEELKGIYVNKGQRLTIEFTMAYDGLIGLEPFLSTRLSIEGWSLSPRQFIGTIPRGSKTKVTFVWDNTKGECTLKYFDINLAIKNNVAINSDFCFEWFYDTLTVKVEDIPKGAQDIIDNQNENTDKIIQNQDENTDKEIEAEKDLYEEEKQEATDTGEQSVEDAMSAMPNDSDGLLDSFGTFIGCMLTNSTDCEIEFPALKTPAIGGLPSYTLSEKQTVNFNEFENIIPNSILLIVRALLTIALIIFCYKELYSTIQYIVSLRKGGGD